MTSIAGAQCKTTMVHHMLMPFMPNPVVVQIEDWNFGRGHADLKIGAKAFYALAAQINSDREQSFILDVGASNSKMMMAHFDDLELTRKKIHYFVIPVRAGSKERIDALKTVSLILDMGVDPSNVVMIATAVQDVDMFDHEFGPLKAAAARDGFHFAEQAVLFNGVFDMLKGSDKNVFEIVRDAPDFNQLLDQHRGDEKKLIEIGNQMLIYSLASKAARNLKAVFESTPIAAAILM
jgi:hypothetical protein